VEVISGGEQEGVIISFITVQNIFDLKGRKIGQTRKWQDGSPVSEEIYEYDEEGNNIIQLSSNTDGSFSFLKYYGYDDQGNWTEEFRYAAGGTTSVSLRRNKYQYDVLGKKIKSVNFEQDGTKWVNRFNPNGDLRESQWYSADGTLKMRQEFQLDEFGNKKEFRGYDVRGRLLSHTLTSYEYDSRGNWVKRIHKWLLKDGQPNDEVNKTDRAITYFETVVK